MSEEESSLLEREAIPPLFHPSPSPGFQGEGGGKTNKEEQLINQSDRTGHLQAIKSINL
jgi:hypothetical protein